MKELGALPCLGLNVLVLIRHGLLLLRPFVKVSEMCCQRAKRTCREVHVTQHGECTSKETCLGATQRDHSISIMGNLTSACGVSWPSAVQHMGQSQSQGRLRQRGVLGPGAQRPCPPCRARTLRPCALGPEPQWLPRSTATLACQHVRQGRLPCHARPPQPCALWPQWRP